MVGEWMPLTVFMNTGKQLKRTQGNCEVTAANCQNSSGWWQSLNVTDLNDDGYPDIIAGNYGLNSKLTASPAFPLKLFLFDYDNNGVTDQILAYAKDGKYYTFLGKDELEKQLPSIKKDFLQYKGFAGKTVEDIFGDKLNKAGVLEVATMASQVFMNDGKGNFVARDLPFMCQLSPVFAIMTEDVDGNGKKDILCGGNFYGVLPYEGRYDASYGNLLLQDNAGYFHAVPMQRSGLAVRGEIRDMQALQSANGKPYVIIARNNDSLILMKRGPGSVFP
jgi:hypothetical protein